MGKIRKFLLGSLQIGFIIFLISSCSIPRIIIYEDPLSPQEHNDLGVAYEKKELLKLAEKEYRKAVKKSKNWDVPYFNLANVYFKQGNYKKAEEYYKKALHINPENADALNNLAYLYYTLGRYSEAYRLIKRALSIKMKKEYLQTMKEIEEKIYESD
ncbi:tetratricopeptide repeat protein [Persephonella sp.]